MSKFTDDLAPIGGLQPLGGNTVTQPKTESVPPLETPIVSSSPALPPGIGYGPSNPALRHSLPPHSASYQQPYDAPEGSSKLPIYITGGVGLAMLVGIAIAFIPAAPVAPPTNWEPFVAADQSFSCDLPKEWYIKAMGKASTEKEASIGDGVLAKKEMRVWK